MENLFTNGSEFKLPNGRRYRGYYHVHPEKGAMVGATHVNGNHEVLQPINKLAKQKMDKMQLPVTPVVQPSVSSLQQAPVRPSSSGTIGY